MRWPMSDLISIITPVHNAEDFVSECIESVRNQTYTNWEHILVDDCSSDRSAEIIKSYSNLDPRIKCIKLIKNSGAGIARNKAIEISKGTYIAFLDCDDLWYSDKLQKQRKYMKENNCFFSFSSYDKIDEDSVRVGKKVMAKPRISYRQALLKNPIGCLTAMYDVNFYGKQYMPSIRKRQDYALWLKLLKKADAHGLPESLASYRVRKSSISSNKLSLLKYEWKIYREEEGLPFLKSAFYLVSAVVYKMKSYF